MLFFVSKSWRQMIRWSENEITYHQRAKNNHSVSETIIFGLLPLPFFFLQGHLLSLSIFMLHGEFCSSKGQDVIHPLSVREYPVCDSRDTTGKKWCAIQGKFISFPTGLEESLSDLSFVIVWNKRSLCGRCSYMENCHKTVLFSSEGEILE